MPSEGTSRVLELEQRLRQLTLLQDAVRKINSTLDLDQLLNEIVIDLAGAFGCNHTALLLFDEPSDELEIIAIHGFSDSQEGIPVQAREARHGSASCDHQPAHVCP